MAGVVQILLKNFPESWLPSSVQAGGIGMVNLAKSRRLCASSVFSGGWFCFEALFVRHTETSLFLLTTYET